MKLTVYGSSDDLVEMDGTGVTFPSEGGRTTAEYNVYPKGNCPVVFLIRDGADKTRAVLYAIYGEGGCWTFAVGQADEEVPVPPGLGVVVLAPSAVTCWPSMNGYSMVLTATWDDDGDDWTVILAE
jgi:hypothetical protein